MHNQAVSWSLPPGFVRHAWDADGLAGEQPLWGQFWKIEAASKSETNLLLRGRDAVFGEPDLLISTLDDVLSSALT